MSFPLTPQKTKSEPLLSARQFLDYLKSKGQGPQYSAPQRVIIGASAALARKIGESSEQGRSESFLGARLWIDHQASTGLLTHYGIGAPAIAAKLEELVAFGCQQFVFIGTAGTLQPKHGAGQILVVTQALRDEGCSYHYLDKADPWVSGSPRLLEQVREALAQTNAVDGKVWTTDAPYRETAAEIVRWQKQGVDAVEMEVAAFYSVSHYLGVDSQAIVVVSDDVSRGTWKPQFHFKDVARNQWQVLQALWSTQW